MYPAKKRSKAAQPWRCHHGAEGKITSPMFGLLAKARCHNPWLKTTARLPPGSSSSGNRVRPSIGSTRKTEKKLADTKRPRIRSATSPPIRMKLRPVANSPTHAPFLACGLFDFHDRAEFSQRGVARFLRRHPRVDVRLRCHFEMETHLFVHLRIQVPLAEERAESKLKFVHDRLACFHSWSSFSESQVSKGRIALSIAAEQHPFDSRIASATPKLMANEH